VGAIWTLMKIMGGKWWEIKYYYHY
jgi:hypothetical protein